jgi:membrane-bound serine protease (ClpP class)
MQFWRAVRYVGWGFLLAGLIGLALKAQDRASDLLKNPPPVEAPEAVEAVEAGPEEGSGATPLEPSTEAAEAAEETAAPDRLEVVVVPITGAISGPNEYILRRAVKGAIESGANALVLDIDTPGGSVATLLEMLELVDRFSENSTSIAFINDEAISAGALLSAVADEIWYTPKAVIGSAGVVVGSGQDVPETMKQKIESFLQAKIRALSTDHRYRGDVVRAMMDEDFELKIDGKVISEEGVMLNLTAEEAMRTYGRPPEALFGDGIAKDIDALLDARFGAGSWELTRLEVTWSEELAKYLNTIAPLMVALGILAIFIEVKTPGFGVFGAIGIVLIVIVFSINYLTGLAGMEPAIVFFVGVALIALELFVFPGTFIAGAVGLLLVVGSLLWSMADLWPTVEGGIEVDFDALFEALADLSISFLLTGIGLALVWKFLPETSAFKRVTLQTTVGATSETLAHGGGSAKAALPDLGAEGKALTPLRPLGRIEVGGEVFEARADEGFIDSGEAVIVVAYKQYYLLVERAPA